MKNIRFHKRDELSHHQTFGLAPQKISGGREKYAGPKAKMSLAALGSHFIETGYFAIQWLATPELRVLPPDLRPTTMRWVKRSPISQRNEPEEVGSDRQEIVFVELDVASEPPYRAAGKTSQQD